MPDLIRLYESIGFRKADIRHVFGVEFQRMVYKEDERYNSRVFKWPVYPERPFSNPLTLFNKIRLAVSKEAAIFVPGNAHFIDL